MIISQSEGDAAKVREVFGIRCHPEISITTAPFISLSDKDMTGIVAEHDISLMARYCDVCVIMKQGSIVAVGKPKDIITEDLIREVYEVDSRIGLDADGEIYVLPKDYVGDER